MADAEPVSETPPFPQQKSQGLNVTVYIIQMCTYNMFNFIVVLPSVNNEATKNTGM